MAGLIAVGMAFASSALVVSLIGLCYGFSSARQSMACFDAMLLCIYFAAEFGHGGGNPSNRSGL